MRADQWVGLNERGSKYLADHFERKYHRNTMVFWELPEDPSSKPERSEESGSGIPPWYITESLGVEGAWDEFAGYLHTYECYTSEENETAYAREEIQAEPWSSGPMYFVALKDKDDQWIPETLWTEKEMSEY